MCGDLERSKYLRWYISPLLGNEPIIKTSSLSGGLELAPTGCGHKDEATATKRGDMMI